jgi:hypothetical protein
MSALEAELPLTAFAAPLSLPRDEMAFRDRYQDLLLGRAITTVFRPGDRSWPNWRGYSAGERITARVIERPGDDALRVPPRFNAVRVPIWIRELAVRPVAQLADADFEGSSPDVTDSEGLLTHLFEIYRRPISAYGGLVTRIRIAYEAPRWARQDK